MSSAGIETGPRKKVLCPDLRRLDMAKDRRGPWWKSVLRTVLISVGTALVVRLVDALLYPEEREG